jgi:hypothetical protein
MTASDTRAAQAASLKIIVKLLVARLSVVKVKNGGLAEVVW